MSENKQQVVVLASGNAGKLREFDAMLKPLAWDIKPQAELNVSEVPETGLSFVENALIKARNASLQTQLPAIADDSGIEVDALNGAPGIYSARYAGENCNDDDNNQKLLTDLAAVPAAERSARYRACLVYLRHAKDPVPIIAEGYWEGLIVDQPRGEHGFGYDPYFWLTEFSCTAAELSPERKNKISHRASALAVLLKRLLESQTIARKPE